MWAALNAGERGAAAVVGRERATQEAQDAQNAALYEQALRHQQRRRAAAARAIYAGLLEVRAVCTSTAVISYCLDKVCCHMKEWEADDDGRHVSSRTRR